METNNETKQMNLREHVSNQVNDSNELDSIIVLPPMVQSSVNTVEQNATVTTHATYIPSSPVLKARRNYDLTTINNNDIPMETMHAQYSKNPLHRFVKKKKLTHLYDSNQKSEKYTISSETNNEYTLLSSFENNIDFDIGVISVISQINHQNNNIVQQSPNSSNVKQTNQKTNLPTITASSSKRGRPRKRSIEEKKLIETFSKLSKIEFESLDTVTWSSASTSMSPNIWSVMCLKLEMKDNEKNKKWLSHIWQTNIWNVAGEVRNIFTLRTNVTDLSEHDAIVDTSVLTVNPEQAKSDITNIGSSFLNTENSAPAQDDYCELVENIVKFILDEAISQIVTPPNNEVCNEASYNAIGKQILDEVISQIVTPPNSEVCNEASYNAIGMEVSPVKKQEQDVSIQNNVSMNTEDFDSQEDIIPNADVLLSNNDSFVQSRTTDGDDFYEWYKLGEREPIPDELKSLPCFADVVLYEHPQSATNDECNNISFDKKSVDVDNKNVNDKKDENIEDRSNIKKCVHNEVKPGAISLPNEQRELIDVLLDRPSTAGKYEADVPSEELTLEIDKTDLDHLLKLFNESKLKKNQKSSKSEDSSTDTRNTGWIDVFQKYISKLNGTCVFMHEGHHFSTAKSFNASHEKRQFLISTKANCKFSECKCSFSAKVYTNRDLSVSFKGKIIHSPSEQRARPIRGASRTAVAEQLSSGMSPDQLRLKQLGRLTEENRTFGNYNAIGASPHVYRKIGSEKKTALMRDQDLASSLEKIKKEQSETINAGKTISGYLQTISIDPLRLVLFTDGALYFWKANVDKIPLSWDATGGLVVNRKNNKRIYYYELTAANISPVTTAQKSSGPSFPITSMVSNSHTTLDLVHWLEDFEKAYRKVYGCKGSFPKPPIVHSDGSIVFQLAAMRFFNGDMNLSTYLQRCWSIVNKTATVHDLKKTLIHSCLAHFVKSLKHTVVKYYTKNKVPFILWLLSLLINCNTIEEMTKNWEHICVVLLSPTQNSSYSISISWLSNEANNINKDPNKINFITQNVQVNSNGLCEYASTFADDVDQINANDEDTDDIVTEENEFQQSDSPFRDYFTKIYKDQLDRSKQLSSQTTQATMENPYYNPEYLERILTLYLPVAPIWSNLMMGNLGRYGYKFVQQIEHCGCHNSRTTGISESRMKVTKSTILGDEVYSRVDQVIQKLGANIRQVEINYSNHYLVSLTRNRNKNAKSEKKVLSEEGWNKRTTPATSTPVTGIYSQQPKKTLIKQAQDVQKKTPNLSINKNNRNIGNAVGINLELKPHVMLTGQNLSWLNSSIQLVLSNNILVEIMLNHPFIEYMLKNENINRKKTVTDVNNERVNISDLFPKIEEITIRFILNILKMPLTKPIDILTVKKYIDDIRQYGPKKYVEQLKTSVPLIEPMGEMSPIEFYISYVLIQTISNFFDTSIIWDELFHCSLCKSDNINATMKCSLLKLTIRDFNEIHIVEAAFKHFFVNETADACKTCTSCCKQSDTNQYCRSIIQLPDALFVAFMNDLNSFNRNEQIFLIPNDLDLSNFLSPDIICFPSYSRFKLNSFIVGDVNSNGNFFSYTIAKYNEQFYVCNDELIEPINKAAVFEKKHAIPIALYIREKNYDINFVEIIQQILFDETNIASCTSSQVPHVKTRFDAALETVFPNTNVLSWNQGYVFPCLVCKKKNEIYTNDCVLFSYDKHISNDGEISLDDTLIQPKMTPKLKCAKECEGGWYRKNGHYIIFKIPQFIFVIFSEKPKFGNSSEKPIPTQTGTTSDTYSCVPRQQIHTKCKITQTCFNYDLYRFLVITKDEQTLIVEPTINDKYKIYNKVTKSYEDLPNYRFEDFLGAAATNIILCYATYDTAIPNPTLKLGTLDVEGWTQGSNFNWNILNQKFICLISSCPESLKIGPYQLKKADVIQITDPTSQLNDLQLNAHLYTTTTKIHGCALIDSLVFTNYYRRGFKQSTEFTSQSWFTENIILIPVHHTSHWFLFIVNIYEKKIILFDSLPNSTIPYQKYTDAIIQLLKKRFFYTRDTTQLNFKEWTLINDFPNWRQDDAVSCGVYCALFAQGYALSFLLPKVDQTNIKLMRTQCAIHLLECRKK